MYFNFIYVHVNFVFFWYGKMGSPNHLCVDVLFFCKKQNASLAREKGVPVVWSPLTYSFDQISSFQRTTAPPWTPSKMQKSVQKFSNRSRTILFSKRVRLSKHRFFIFNATKFETSIFWTHKCSKLFLWALSNWSLFRDRFAQLSWFINEQTRLQKRTLMSVI